MIVIDGEGGGCLGGAYCSKISVNKWHFGEVSQYFAL